MNLALERAKAIQKTFKGRNPEVTRKLLDHNIKTLENSELADVKWVGHSTAKILMENWIKTQNELAATSMEKINKLKGLNPIAKKAIEKFISSHK